MTLPRFTSRRVPFALAAAAVSLAVSTGHAEEEQHGFRIEEGEDHGSQVASSDWLAVIIGGAAGLAAGAVAGFGVDDHQPAFAGPIIGGAIGAIAGGAGGAWIIRSVRERPTRLAATVTVAALGLGLGAIFYVKTNNWYEGAPAVVLLPIMGALVGDRLAVAWGPKKRGGDTVVMVPTATPVFARGHGVRGVAFGFEGRF